MAKIPSDNVTKLRIEKRHLGLKQWIVMAELSNWKFKMRAGKCAAASKWR
jgi:hypothetical protein